MRRLLIATATAALVAGGGLVASAAQPAVAGNPHQISDIQLLAINDFHGNLEPPSGSSGTVTAQDPAGNLVKVPAGGAAYLATHLKNARAGKQFTTTVAAGDIIGASPLLSAAFHDEPTVSMLDYLGLEATAVGNHEFDEGRDELLRMQNGGCHPVDGCATGAEYPGAGFHYLAANVLDNRSKKPKPILPPYWVKEFDGGMKIGFIGMTLKGTPDVVTKSGVEGLTFTDEVTTANHYVSELRQRGVMAIVVLLHEGGQPSSQVYNYDCNAGGNLGLSGPIVDIAKRLSPSIDLVVTGHTHQSYACAIPDPMGRPRMVTSAGSFGREYTDISLGYDRNKRDIVRVNAQNKIVTRDVPADAGATEMINKYKALVAPIANRMIGNIAGDIPRGPKPESPLGDLIADAQLAATAAPDKGGAQIAFMNPGGIRADLTFPPSGSEGNGAVTYGECFAVQPFNNFLVTKTMTGAQILAVLQQQYTGSNAGTGMKILQVSSGFTYTLTGFNTVSDVKLNGAPLDPAGSYRVTMNSFLADGGDGFAEFAKGTDKLVGGLDIDAFTAYLTANSSTSNPLSVPAANRITFQ